MESKTTRNALFSLASMVVLWSIPSALFGATCQGTDPVDTLCTLDIADIRPTQFSVGSVAVSCKAQKISKKSKRDLKKYLAADKRVIPVVIGPDENFYMVDHHHLVAALYQAHSSKWTDQDKILNIKILNNFSAEKMTWGEFWETMRSKNYCYNSDNKGTPRMNFALLPVNVGGLLNDPYRTLSRWVRESCGYVKAGKKQCEKIRTDHEHKSPFFMEFVWADFFRKQLPLELNNLKVCESIPYSPTCLENEITQLKSIYKKAMKLAASEKAKNYLTGRKLTDQDPDFWDYGYNPSENQLPMEWSGAEKSCEKPVTR